MGEPPRKKARAPSYKIEIAGDDSHKAKIYEMIKVIKHHMLVIHEFDRNKTVTKAHNYGYQNRLWNTFMRLK